jgi:precorrin-6x reductase
LDDIIAWLNTQKAVVFSTLGAKEAKALTAVAQYKERVWLRILPNPEGLTACLEAGFSPKRLICMQGPFSKMVNSAIFRESGADVLLTKDSGAEGGYLEKVEAAHECGMTVAVLARPEEDGLTLDAVIDLIERGGV